MSMEDNNMTGNIPPELGTLTDLNQIRFASNNIIGRLPSRIGKISELKYLDLHDNQITGQIKSLKKYMTLVTFKVCDYLII